jgi:hypothetical protein
MIMTFYISVEALNALTEWNGQKIGIMDKFAGVLFLQLEFWTPVTLSTWIGHVYSLPDCRDRLRPSKLPFRKKLMLHRERNML